MDEDEDAIVERIFHKIAAARGLRLGYNTHYEAYNYVFSWWKDAVHHRLDFQPMEDFFQVAHMTDRYKLFPRLCHWLDNVLPEVFRCPPSVELAPMGTIRRDSEEGIEASVESLLERVL
jgi:hypothetical protein